MNKTVIDTNWEEIFRDYNVINKINKDGFFVITSKQINSYKEARLMAKFDHKAQLPQIFNDNNLTILPINRGTYIIGHFEAYLKFQESKVEIKTVSFPSYLESLNYKDISSESTVINCAFVSNILQDFIEEKELYPTVSGRMSSSKFSFNISKKFSDKLFEINVENSQIEIDGGFEGEKSLAIIEAKNYISDDFLVRQLYYPFRLWREKVSKIVRPLFISYSNGIFHLREYQFFDPSYYNSISLIKEKKYIIQDGTFNLEELIFILNNTSIVEEPKVAFPQADKFERVINLCELLSMKEVMTKEEITLNYGFDRRQTDYYSNAAKYLGLLENIKDPITGQIACRLTSLGLKLFKENLIQRRKSFVRLILQHEVFKKVLSLTLKDGEVPNKRFIVDIMQQCNLYEINSSSTFIRRASTIIGWINWILDQLEE